MGAGQRRKLLSSKDSLDASIDNEFDIGEEVFRYSHIRHFLGHMLITSLTEQIQSFKYEFYKHCMFNGTVHCVQGLD